LQFDSQIGLPRGGLKKIKNNSARVRNPRILKERKMREAIAQYTVCALAACCAIACAGSAARGAVTFDLVATQPSYSFPPGGSTAVQVYLRETLSGGSPSLLAVEDGLFSAVAQLSLTGPPPTAPATITGATRDATNFDDFNNSSVAPGGAQATAGGTRDFADADGTPIITDNANVRRVSIGTFTITAGGLPSQTTTFQVADRRGTSDTLTWTNGTVLDSQIAPSTLTIVTTPEPSMSGLALTVAAALAWRRCRPRPVDT
jgi:hypothetical protein